MISLLTETGFGSCLVLAIGVIGIPAAVWHDARKRRRP